MSWQNQVAQNDMSDSTQTRTRTVNVETPPVATVEFLLANFDGEIDKNVEYHAFEGEGVTIEELEEIVPDEVTLPDVENLNVEELFNIEFEGDYVGSIYRTKAERFDNEDLEEAGYNPENLDGDEPIDSPNFRDSDGDMLVDIDTSTHLEIQKAINGHYAEKIWDEVEEGAKLKVGVATGVSDNQLERRKYLKFRLSKTDNTKEQVLNDVMATGRITESEKDQILAGEKELLEVVE